MQGLSIDSPFLWEFIVDLILYRVKDGENVINKTMTDKLVIPINLKRDADIVSPEIVLKNIDGVDFNSYNYAHIPLLKRYYFINSITNLNNVLNMFSLECDVLETYKEDILNCDARFKRKLQHGDYMDSVVDKSLLTTVAKHESDKVVFKNKKSIILTTLGG